MDSEGDSKGGRLCSACSLSAAPLVSSCRCWLAPSAGGTACCMLPACWHKRTTLQPAAGQQAAEMTTLSLYGPSHSSLVRVVAYGESPLGQGSCAPPLTPGDLNPDTVTYPVTYPDVCSCQQCVATYYTEQTNDTPERAPKVAVAAQLKLGKAEIC